jgi:hypothetical protein
MVPAPIRSGLRLDQVFAVVSGTSLLEAADQAANRFQPSSPSAPLSAMPIRTQLS